MAGSASRRISPELVVAAGCAIALITVGPRATAGLFQIPMTTEYGWGRDVFSLAIALQNLLWGVGQPFAGAVADRFGAVRVICAGAILYALGLVGHGLCGDARADASRRRRAHRLRPLGLAPSTSSSAPSASSCRRNGGRSPSGPAPRPARSASSSFRRSANLLIDGFGWHQALVVFAVTVLVAMPFSLVLARRGDALGGGPAAAARQSIPQALAEAFRHRSYVLLVLGFFTCGFQLAFITAHLPAYPQGRRASGLGRRLDARRDRPCERRRLALGRLAVDAHAQPLAPRLDLFRALGRHRRRSSCRRSRPRAAIVFGIAIGLLWLSTVPPTSSLVMLMFGTRYMAMLFGFAFFSHQVGGFLGVYLGGVLYEAYGSYDLVWWLSVALGIASAAINLPIEERPVERAVPVPAE